MEILKCNMYIFEQRMHIHNRIMRHDKSIRNLHNSHWNVNAIFFKKLSLLAAVEVVKMTIFSAFNDFHFIEMTTFPLSVSYQIMHLYN